MAGCKLIAHQIAAHMLMEISPVPQEKERRSCQTPPGESAQGYGLAHNLLQRLQTLPQQYNEIRWLSFRCICLISRSRSRSRSRSISSSSSCPSRLRSNPTIHLPIISPSNPCSPLFQRKYNAVSMPCRKKNLWSCILRSQLS